MQPIVERDLQRETKRLFLLHTQEVYLRFTVTERSDCIWGDSDASYQLSPPLIFGKMVGVNIA